MYLKGGIADPVQYGRMYLAAVQALGKAGIHTTLLFNLTGDYPIGSWTQPQGWSADAGGGGWLRDAVNGVPGLTSAIAANGVSIHPYGGVHENVHDDTGIASAAALEGVARTVLPEATGRRDASGLWSAGARPQHRRDLVVPVPR
jgi:hypothetical protein